jgi:Zn-dependent protease
MLVDFFSGDINIITLLSWFIALAIAVTVHEFSHALTADKLGDPTARYQGRVTLNPLAHLDPLGTVMILLTRFGWGRPVPFNPWNLKNPKQDALLISLAGPAANLITAFILSFLLKMILLTSLLTLPLVVKSILVSVVTLSIVLNVFLAVFNLIPVAPLDGFKVVGGLLPRELAQKWEGLERYGLVFLIILIIPLGGTSLAGTIISPVLNNILQILIGA